MKELLERIRLLARRNDYILFLIIGSGGTVILNLMQMGNGSLFISVILMLILVSQRVHQYRQKGDVLILEESGEQIYLMGYLLTIAALTASLFHGEFGTTNVFIILSTKLTTTLIGLAVMLWFKEKARQHKDRNQDDDDIKLRITEEVDGILNRLSNLSGSLAREMESTFSVFDPKETAAIAKSIGEFKNSLVLANNNLPHFTQALTKMSESMRENSPAWEEFSETTQSLHESTQSIARASERMSIGSERFKDNITTAIENLEQMKVDTNGLSSASIEATSNLTAIGNTAGHFTQSINKIAEDLNSWNMAVKGIKLQSEDQLLNELQSTSKGVNELTNQHQTGFKNLTDSITRLNEQLTKHQTESDKGLKEVTFSNALSQLVDTMRQTQKLNEQMAHSLETITMSITEREDSKKGWFGSIFGNR